MREPQPRRPWAAIGAAVALIGALFLGTTGPCSVIFGIPYLIHNGGELLKNGQWPSDFGSGMVDLWLEMTAIGIFLVVIGLYLGRRYDREDDS
jgi:hypothetical protein